MKKINLMKGVKLRLAFLLISLFLMTSCVTGGLSDSMVTVVYKTTDKGALAIDILLPETGGMGFCPVVLYFHGGTWVRGDRTGCLERGQHEVVSALLANGIAVASADYSLASYTSGFPEMIEDARDALAWLSEKGAAFGLDSSKIGLWGYSAGAHLALISLLYPEEGKPESNSARFVLSFAGPVDLSALFSYHKGTQTGDFLDEELYPLIKEPGKAKEDLLREYSPLYQGPENLPTVFLYTGEADDAVPPGQAEALAEAMEKGGNTPFFRIVPEGNHGFSSLSTQKREALANEITGLVLKAFE